MMLIAKHTKPSTAAHQQGVALVMAMLIVVLVTAIAVEISWRFELSISRSENRWSGVQAKTYQVGAEQYALEVLRMDIEGDETKASDHLNEFWASEQPPIPTDHGFISGRLEDANGRFNINLMRPAKGNCSNDKPRQNGICEHPADPCEKYSPAQLVFLRLLQTINIAGPEDEEPVYLDTALAEGIVEAVIDWLDDDSEINGFGGAESNYYEQLTPVTTIANMQMISVSELQQIKGMIPRLYRGLLPYVIALPISQTSTQTPGGQAGQGGQPGGQQTPSAMNINTAKAPILRSIRATGGVCDLLPLTEEEGQEIASVISAGEYQDNQELQSDPMLPSAWMNGNQLAIDTNLFGVLESTYFLFFSQVGIGESYVREGQALLKREQGNNGLKLQVVRRSDANF